MSKVGLNLALGLLAVSAIFFTFYGLSNMNKDTHNHSTDLFPFIPVQLFTLGWINAQVCDYVLGL